MILFFYRIGRKRAILFSALPFTIAWILIATANSVYQLYVSRFISGAALAIDFTVVPMYCGEIAEVNMKHLNNLKLNSH